MNDLQDIDGRAVAAALRAPDDAWVADALSDVVIPIGVAMASEADYDRLLERILIDAMSLCGADGGTLYLRREQSLHFAIIRTTSLGIAMGGTSGKSVAFAPLALRDATTGLPNNQSVAARAALSGQAVNVPDVYDPDVAARFDFTGARRFDAANGYRTRSVLAVPLFEQTGGAVSGVVQLINAGTTTNGADGIAVPFSAPVQRVVESLCRLAGAALTNYVRQQQLKDQVRQLRIEIDASKRDRQVQEISDSDYFKRLKGRVRELQQRVRTNDGSAGGDTASAGDGGGNG